MERHEVFVGMRVRVPARLVHKLNIEDATDPENPVGTVMAIHDKGDDKDDLFGWYELFPVEVKWDGVDYSQPVYRHGDGEQWYDSVSLGEIEAA